MNRNEIITLAREAGLGTSLTHSGGAPRVWIEGADWHDELTRFAALVRNATLEEAARVCENTLAQQYMKQVIPTSDEALLLAACADCAAAIRAMKE